MLASNKLKNDTEAAESCRAQEIYRDLRFALTKRTDHFFVILMIVQWAAAVLIAAVRSPYTYEGAEASVHPHVVVAVCLGGMLAIGASFFGWFCPGEWITRHVMAVAQMLMSALIIHLTDGRIESHFHVFGSLAFLAFYRDPSVLVTAAFVTAGDHLLRGVFWPMSLYGEAGGYPWRWLEHTGWVAFENGFLIYSCYGSRRDLHQVSEQQARLEGSNSRIESEVLARTAQLEESHRQLDAELARGMESEKMAALGVMAAGIAQEISNPVAAIHLNSSELQMICESEAPDLKAAAALAATMEKSVVRIARIVNALRSFAREGSAEPFHSEPLYRIMESAVESCRDKFAANRVQLKVAEVPADFRVKCRPGQISQVLLHLLQNALDAVEGAAERWVSVEWSADRPLELSVRDSGRGVPAELRETVFQPFFSTKDSGEGTGLGLSVSRGIMETHKGRLCLDPADPACFVMKFGRQHDFK